MEPYKENIISTEQMFPVDVFIQDNVKSNVVVAPHWHDCIEILFMLSGTARQQVNDRVFEAVKNDIILINHGDVHATHCTSGEDTRILVVKFLPDILNFYASMTFESKYIAAFLNNKNEQVCHISDQNEAFKDIMDLMASIHNEFVGKKPGFEIFIKGCIYKLIAYLIRVDLLTIYTLDLKEKQLRQLDKLLKYIEENYASPINLKKAASMMNFSYYYLSRYFKKVTGKNFKEYIDFVRVCEAEKLLMSKDMAVSQAAYEVGFSNISSFNRVFKRVRNYTPFSVKRTKTANK